VTFVEHLRLSFRWGGFPGWERYDPRPEQELITSRPICCRSDSGGGIGAPPSRLGGCCGFGGGGESLARPAPFFREIRKDRTRPGRVGSAFRQIPPAGSSQGKRGPGGKGGGEGPMGRGADFHANGKQGKV
jgi:hypothetical protein